MPHLNERQRRLLLAAEARLLGHGGVRAVARVAGVSETTVRAGVLELEEGQEPFPEGRVRRGGGGRKGAAALDAGLVPALLALVEPDERAATRNRRCGGRPSRCGSWPASWPGRGIRCRRPRPAARWRENGFSLQGNAKTLEGDQHPDRDAQFRYINEQAKDHQRPASR